MLLVMALTLKVIRESQTLPFVLLANLAEINSINLHMRTASYFGTHWSSLIASLASQTRVSTSPTRRLPQTMDMWVPVVFSNNLINSKTDNPLPKPKL